MANGPIPASVNAIAMSDASDYAVLVSGADSAGTAGVWSTRLGSGVGAPPGVWLPLTEVSAAASGTNVTYMATGAGFAATSRLAFAEVYAGSGAYTRLHLSQSMLAEGADAFISFGTPRDAGVIPDTEVVSVDLVATNGRVASNLPANEIRVPVPMSPEIGRAHV
mgnify:CR=1 FL=1